MRSLTDLNLNTTAITSRSLAYLGTLPALNNLDLGYTKLFEENAIRSVRIMQQFHKDMEGGESVPAKQQTTRKIEAIINAYL
jgi:hypothetical protein